MIGPLAVWFAAAAFQGAAPNASDLGARYVIAYDPAATPALWLELHVLGDDDGESSFSVPPGWGGVTHLADHLHDLVFRDADDATRAPLAVTRAGEVGWNVAHAARARLVASWWLGEPQPPASGTGNDYRPRVTPDHFRFLGSAGLLRPDVLAGEARHRFTLEFVGCEGEARAAACSFGAGPRLEVTETLDAFCHAIFMGGAIRVHRRDLDGHELLLALAGKFPFDDAEFVALAERIVRLERDFFADRGGDRFVITLVPEPGSTERVSLGGTGLTRSFALFMSQSVGLKPGSDDALRISGLLAHEYFHHWNGEIVRVHEATEGLGYWFSEGFTDFFTRRLMVRSGIWSVKQWLGEWNNCLGNFTRNPARTAPAERIAREFWSDRNVSDLPYQRGAIVAALLDQEIGACNDGKQSLDDFMRDLVVRARAGESPDTAALLELVADWTSAEFAEQLRAIVVDGALPPLHDAELLFGPLFRWVQRPDRSGAAAVAGAGGATVPTLELLPGTSEAEARAEL